MSNQGRDNVLFACGEFTPGTRTIGTPIIISIPPRIIPTHERTPTLPPLPRRDDDDVPPVIVNPDPVNPQLIPPVNPDPTNPFFIPFVPPDPIGNGIPPNQGEPPRIPRDDPTLIIGGGVTMRLEDLGGPGGGGGGGEFFEEETPTRRILSLQEITTPQNILPEDDPTSRINPNISLEDQGSENFPGPLYTETIDLRDGSQRSAFSNNFTGNNLYDPIYNILDYSNSQFQYVSNNLYRNIFSAYVSKEVDFLLRKSTLETNWTEENITGLTVAKLTQSLNTTLLEAFDTILDINGIQVTRFYFLNKVFNHLISGTLDEFDSEFYMNLAESISSRPKLNIIQTTNEQTKKNRVLALMSEKSHSAYPPNYDNTDSNRDYIEVSRMKFLLSDLESTIDVEVLDGTEYQLELADGGIFVESAVGLQESASVSSEYVPPGPGDGYYFTIELSKGSLVPLVMDNELRSAYYVDNDVRKLGLDLLAQDSSYRLEATVDLINSEFSSGFNESYLASAHYYKLDLGSIQSKATIDNFIENTTATYKKLTDADAIAEHSKTYGSKVTQFNVQYDDIFLQYADTAGEMVLTMKDLTFRQFTPKRSPTNQIILTRNLPDGFILYPVKDTKDNPTGAYSKINNFGDKVSRTLKGEMNFTTEEGQSSKRTLRATNIWQQEGNFSYGLIGFSDPENLYYLYDPEDFPNTFEVSGRSEVGNLVYNVLSRLENKYSFDHLNWWDVYRRLPYKSVAKLMFDFPEVVSSSLYEGWKGYRIKNVLYRYGIAPDNLTEVDPNIDDPTYLEEGSRNV